MDRLRNMNPTVRGLLIVALIALVVMALQLYATLAVVSGLLTIAFFLAMAFFVYLWWRDNRAEIDLWSQRSRWVFYGGAALIVVDLGAFFSPFRKFELRGFAAFSFIAVLILCAFSMWRVWKDEKSYGM